MKKLLTCLTLIFSILSFVTSCDQKMNDDQNVNKETVELRISGISHSGATAEITPSNMSAPYFARLYAAPEVAGGSDAEIIEKAKSDPEFGDFIYVGKKNIELKDLKASTDYIFIAFCSSEKGTGKVAKAEFTTLERGSDSGESFQIENVNVKYTSIEMDVIPDRKDQPYTTYTMMKKWYEEYKAEGPDGVITHAYYGLQNLSVEEGFGTIGEYLKETAKTGNSHIVSDGLKSEEEYVLLIFYVDTNATDPTVIYDTYCFEYPFKTKEPTGEAKPELKITMKKSVDKDGNLVVNINLKGKNAVKGGYNLTDNATAQQYLSNGMTLETLATLFFQFKEEQLKLINSPEGLDMAWPPLEPMDYFFAAALYNEEGFCAADGIEILIEE